MKDQDKTKEQVEESLRQEAVTFKAVAENANDGMLIATGEEIFVYANKRVTDMTGYSIDELLKMNLRVLLHIDESEKVMGRYRARLEGKPVPPQYETVLLRKDGGILTVELTGAKTVWQGEPADIFIIRDIAARKEIENGLEKARKELEVIKQSEDEAREYAESIINTVREPLIALDQDLRVVTASRSFYEIFKVKSEETVGQLIYDLGNKQWNIPKLRELLETILPQKTTFDNYEVEHNFAIIGRRIMLLNARQIQRVLGKERIILLAIEDITERKLAEEELREHRGHLEELVEKRTVELEQEIRVRKQAEEALKQSAQNFHNSIEDSPLGVHIHLHGGESLYVNKAFLDTYGYDSLEEFNATPLSKRTTPESYAAIRERQEKEKQGQLFPDFFEQDIVRNDGEIRHLRVWRKDVTWDGQRRNLRLSEDITEQKKAEEALKLVEQNFRNSLENSPLGIRIHIFGGESLYVNKAFLDIYGFDSIEEFNATPLLKRLTPESIAINLERREKIKRGEPVPESYEQDIVRNDGEIRHLRLWVRKVIWDGKRCDQGLSEDITERKKMEVELKIYRERLEQLVEERTSELTRANMQLEAANKELEAFAYSVSHDLRAPLRSVNGFSQALLEDCADKLDEQEKDYLNRVCSAAGRMAELIDDMLNLSRVTRSEMRQETVDLAALAKSTAAGLRQGQAERQIEFIITPGLVARGDRRLLGILLGNLLDNAWKFTSKQPGARIEFGVAEQEGKPAYFVRDNGVGFDMTYVNKLFTPFQRLHTMSEFPGTGIGLAIVQRIAHRHGGRVWADGKVGKGATFYFTLP